MNGWEVAKLGQLCEIKTGRKDVNQGNPAGKYPFFTCANDHTYSDEYSFEGEALLIAGNGDVGNTSYCNGKFEAYQRTYVLMHFERILPRYLFRVLDGTLKNALFDKKLGNTMPYIKKGMLTEFPVPLPPLPEQKLILGILDEAFEGIAVAVANTEKNLANARELFESYLNGVFTRKGDGWVEKPLHEVLLVQPRNGWSPPAKNHSDSGTPVLTLSSVTGFHFDGGKRKYTNALTKNDAHYWLNDGELLISRSNTHELVGHVAICSDLSEPTICCDLIMKMQVDGNQANTKFVYWNLRSPKLRKLITSSARGANPTMKKINKGVVQNLPLSLPSVTEQTTIADQLDSLANGLKMVEINYMKKLANFNELKQSILQKAFAGELTALTDKTLAEAVA